MRAIRSDARAVGRPVSCPSCQVAQRLLGRFLCVMLDRHEIAGIPVASRTSLISTTE